MLALFVTIFFDYISITYIWYWNLVNYFLFSMENHHEIQKKETINTRFDRQASVISGEIIWVIPSFI